MATKTIAWATGTGSITISYGGSGSGTATITTSDNNLYEARSQEITLRTTAGSPQVTKKVTITQAARVRTDISAAVVTAANQTYSGSALTPTPTVVLNGTTIPSSGYDVTYSNNTNAGSATITVMGKGDYTGTATGTFTINPATGQVTTLPTAINVTYTGSAQYLVTAGAGTGTMQYRYKLSTSSTWSSWSTTRARSTNAGTYNVQYRAAASADGNYTVSDVGTLNVTMVKASRTISFTTKPTSVCAGDTITVEATPSAGANDGTITYSSYDTSIATVSGNVVTGVAEGTVTIRAVISSGTNYKSASTSYVLSVVNAFTKEYFTIMSLANSNAIRWRSSSASFFRNISWSTDKVTWASVSSSNSSGGTLITTLSKGQKLYIKGKAVNYATSSYNCQFAASGDYVVMGNIMSLIYEDDFFGKELSSSNEYAFSYLFKDSTTLVSAKDLILPKKTCARCYRYMFRGCSNLVVGVKTPATTLSEACYYGMYYNCRKLISIGELHASTLTQSCYGYMFYGCSSLRYIYCTASNISATQCTYAWVDGIAANGIFIKAQNISEATWGKNVSGIPSGWTVKSSGLYDRIEIEYLRSTGTQFIDLGIYGTEKYGVEIKFKYHDLSTSSASARIFGTREGSGSKAFGYITSYSGTLDTSKSFYLACRNSATSSSFSTKIDSQDHVVEMNVDNDGKVYIDNTLALTAGSISSFTSTGVASLFRTYSASNGGYLSPAVATIYYIKVYIGGELVLDLIPVRIDSVGYMYDKIRYGLFVNDGTGDFTLGADIVG